MAEDEQTTVKYPRGRPKKGEVRPIKPAKPDKPIQSKPRANDETNTKTKQKPGPKPKIDPPSPFKYPDPHRFALALERTAGNARKSYRESINTQGLSEGQIDHRSRTAAARPEVLSARRVVSDRAINAAATVAARYEISISRIATMLSHLANAEMRDAIDVVSTTDPTTGRVSRSVVVKDWASLPDAVHAAIVEVVSLPSGEIRIKLADKRGAAMDLARLQGWLAQDQGPTINQLVHLTIER